jgi:Acetyltransferase (GNAT) domain
MTTAFRYATEADYPSIASFLDEYWAKNHIYVRSPKLFNWTFHRPGYWETGGYSFALAEDNNEAIGILGGILYTFNVFGKTNRAAWIANYAVRPDHRKGTAAFKLLSMFRNAQFPVVIASGLNPDTVVIYKVLRGQVLPEMPRHVMVLPEAVDRMAKLVQLTKPEWDAARAHDAVAPFAPQTSETSTEEGGSDLPASWDVVDWPAIAAVTVGASRDSDYLEWRYRKHPLFEYRFITLADGERTGLLVWRLETIRQEVDGVRTDLDRIGRVVEFLPTGPENAERLMGILRNQLRKSDAMGADFFGYHGETRRMLTANGMVDTSSTVDGPAIPSRFQPLAPHSPTLNAMFAEPGLPVCDTSADCRWYWTKSDSDQDRPN